MNTKKIEKIKISKSVEGKKFDIEIKVNKSLGVYDYRIIDEYGLLVTKSREPYIDDEGMIEYVGLVVDDIVDDPDWYYFDIN